MDLYMLTTTDNPFSPVTQWDEWLAWDMLHHNSNALLARVARTSAELSDLEQMLAIQEAIDEIVTENVSGVHTKVRAGSEDFSSIDSDDTRAGAEDRVSSTREREPVGQQ